MISDESALVLMAAINVERMRSGEPPNDREAAREAIRRLGLWGANTQEGAIEDRLRGKFRRRREELMAAIRLPRINSQ